MVLDTPPGHVAIIKSAVLAAEAVLVPIAPTSVDVDRLRPTFELLAEIEPVHEVGVGVLLIKMRAGTNSARGIREVLAEQNYPVMETEIPLSEMYAQSHGRLPADLGHYEMLLKELWHESAQEAVICRWSASGGTAVLRRSRHRCLWLATRCPRLSSRCGSRSTLTARHVTTSSALRSMLTLI